MLIITSIQGLYNSNTTKQNKQNKQKQSRQKLGQRLTDASREHAGKTGNEKCLTPLTTKQKRKSKAKGWDINVHSQTSGTPIIKSRVQNNK